VRRVRSGAPGSGGGARLDPRAWTPADLMLEADHARRRAYAPYSRFPVGAALLARDGTVVHGCNVENASYGLTVCAERNAMFQAVGRGMRDFVAIAITAREGRGAPPCGSCRQVLHEFAPHLRVIWRSARGRLMERRLQDLLPNAFVLRPAAGKREKRGTRGKP
jgi:cytidine deaminase